MTIAGRRLLATQRSGAHARDTVLVLSSDPRRREAFATIVEGGGWASVTVASLQEARWELDAARTHLVVLDVANPDESQRMLNLLDEIREREGGGALPVVVVSRVGELGLTLTAYARGADDVVVGHPSDQELVARFRARLERRPTPRRELRQDPVTGALAEGPFLAEVEHELERVSRGGRYGVLALVALDELPALEARYGRRARDEILSQIVDLIRKDSREVDFLGHVRGVLGVLMPATPRRGGHVRLERLVRVLSRTVLVQGVGVRVTPIVGYAPSAPGLAVEQLLERAWLAMMHQAEQLDLHPTAWRPAMSGESSRRSRLARALGRLSSPLQVAAQQLVCLGVPLGVYFALDRIGLDISGLAYIVLVVSLGLTAATIWIEGFTALRETRPPPEPTVLPSATAVIAAYLPNESDTIVETVEAFLEQDYPDLQVLLAYNTPTSLPVEAELQAIAERDSRFELCYVEGSVSKAQNVNAALPRVRGEIVGVFDADHHPDRGAFRRAARWLANGADIVQGHCVVRNGDTNLVTRTIATEFEAIYALAHPGRARLHGFGIFGGSNGYWRTELLERMRMRGWMLTEDIDSSMRVVASGGVIISDPGLVSTELAPTTPRALWNQRMRWAQGWSQVSLRHLRPMVRRDGAPIRSRIGAVYLLAWREVYPWISLQMFPLLAFWVIRGDPPVTWLVPIFVATSLFTLSAGPAQVLLTWQVAHPSIKRHKWWFVLFLVASVLFYTELKNVIVRTAHLKELMGERTWKVTPRVAPQTAVAGPPGGVERRSPTSVGARLRGAPGAAEVVELPDTVEVVEEPALSQRRATR